MSIAVRQSVTIARPAQDLYAFWRDFANLPRIMRHLKSVEVLSGDRSHWVAKGPMNTSVEWDAIITEDTPGRRIAWRSLEDAEVPNEGWVEFNRAPAGQGTEVQVSLSYDPPLGPIGKAVAWLFGEEPNQQVREDLQRFQQLMETGEAASIDDQPSGGRA